MHIEIKGNMRTGYSIRSNSEKKRKNPGKLTIGRLDSHSRRLILSNWYMILLQVIWRPGNFDRVGWTFLEMFDPSTLDLQQVPCSRYARPVEQSEHFWAMLWVVAYLIHLPFSRVPPYRQYMHLQQKLPQHFAFLVSFRSKLWLCCSSLGLSSMLECLHLLVQNRSHQLLRLRPQPM